MHLAEAPPKAHGVTVPTVVMRTLMGVAEVEEEDVTDATTAAKMKPSVVLPFTISQMTRLLARPSTLATKKSPLPRQPPRSTRKRAQQAVRKTVALIQ